MSERGVTRRILDENRCPSYAPAVSLRLAGSYGGHAGVGCHSDSDDELENSSLKS
jgi:hypothetical protein